MLNGKCVTETYNKFNFYHVQVHVKLSKIFILFFTLYSSCYIAQLQLLLCQPYKTLICSKLLPTGNPHFKTIRTKSALLTSLVFLGTLIQKNKGVPKKKKKSSKRTKFCLHRTSTNNVIFYVFELISFMYLVTTAQTLTSLTIRIIPNQGAIMQSNYKSIILFCTKAFSDLDSYS